MLNQHQMVSTEEVIDNILKKSNLRDDDLGKILSLIYVTLLLHFCFEFINKSFQVKAVILLIEAHSKLNLEKFGK